MQPSDAPLREVRLYGHLALDIGRSLELAFRTPADAVRLIELNFPGFARRFRKGLFHLSVTRGGREVDLTEDRLGMGVSGEVLHIMPRAIGKGKGKSVLTALVGGLVIGAAFFVSGGAFATALPGIFGAAGATYGTLATFGAGLVLNGIGSLLTPTRSTDYQEEGRKSYIFNGPVNTTQQGVPMPLVFGVMMVGSVVVSASLDVQVDEEAFEQRALSPALHLPRRNVDRNNRLNMSHLVAVTDGATLTHLNGVALNPSGTINTQGLQIEYSRNGINYRTGGSRGADTRYSDDIYNLKIVWTGTLARRVVLPFVVSTDGGTVTGEIVVTTGDYSDSPDYGR